MEFDVLVGIKQTKEGNENVITVMNVLGPVYTENLYQDDLIKSDVLESDSQRK